MNLMAMLVDDEEHIRLSMQQTLALSDIPVELHPAAPPALARLSPDWAGVVITDVRMPGMDGMSFLHKIRELDPDLPVVMITGHGDVAMAVEAIRAGAYDFIEKPCPAERLVEVVRRAMEKRALVLENRILRQELASRSGVETLLIGKSPPMQRLQSQVRNLAEIDVDVLIHGETGTGKELVARCLHGNSARADAPLVAINCGGLPENIIESELFGHEAGAFTGAAKRRIGKFEHANGGTVFLDEIESMPPAVQVRLLRVLQEREVERVGSNQAIPLDIRVLAATKVDLRKLVNQEKFREDLLYRLNVVTLKIPPLRERPEDIPLLFQHFLLRACTRFRRQIPLVPGEQLDALMRDDWPGNVRELQNAADRFALEFGSGGNPELSGLTDSQRLRTDLTLAERMEAYEKSLIERELIRQRGNITASYTALGLGRKTLYEKMRKYHLEAEEFR